MITITTNKVCNYGWIYDLTTFLNILYLSTVFSLGLSVHWIWAAFTSSSSSSLSSLWSSCSPTRTLLYSFCCSSLKVSFTLARFNPPSLKSSEKEHGYHHNHGCAKLHYIVCMTCRPMYVWQRKTHQRRSTNPPCSAMAAFTLLANCTASSPSCTRNQRGWINWIKRQSSILSVSSLIVNNSYA